MFNIWSMCCSLCREYVSFRKFFYMIYALCYEEVPQKKKFILLHFRFTELSGENLLLLQWHVLPLFLLLGCQMKFGSQKCFYILLWGLPACSTLRENLNWIFFSFVLILLGFFWEQKSVLFYFFFFNVMMFCIPAVLSEVSLSLWHRWTPSREMLHCCSWKKVI